MVQLETLPCGYCKTQENNQNVPIFVGGEGGKLIENVLIFFVPILEGGEG